MSRKHVVWFFVVALVLAMGVVVMAQTTDVVPDAYVRGTGVVQFTNTNYAEFNVNVSQVGPAFFGGFKWAEYANLSATTAGAVVRPIVVVSKQVTGMQFLASNHVVVTAVGYYMDRPANLTFEALDDLNMDWVKITADTIVPPGSTIPSIHYERAGGVSKGNIVIYRKPVGAYIAMGNGSIPIKQDIGVFSFRFISDSSAAGGSGCLYYQEFNPMVMSPMIRPIARIQLTKVTLMKVNGNKAYIEGTGLLNNLPAKITVTAQDNVKPPSPLTIFDYFAITAVPTVPTFVAADYSAGGPVTRGDIIVGRINAAGTL